jgi:hypothetical protein
MVGVFLGIPADAIQGLHVMQVALNELTAHFGGQLTTKVNTQVLSRCKVDWQGAQFTLTLTSNTGYITVQGPSGKNLDFAKHVMSMVGGRVFVAREPGSSPRNPGVEPDAEKPAAEDHDAAAENHGAETLAAQDHDTARGPGQSRPLAARTVGEHGDHDGKHTAHDHAGCILEGRVASSSAPGGSATSTSNAGRIQEYTITGTNNIQIGAVLVNAAQSSSSTHGYLEDLIRRMQGLWGDLGNGSRA